MALTLDAVIPLDNRVKFTRDVFADLIASSEYPANTYLIDNSQDPKIRAACFEFNVYYPNVHYIYKKTNLGVNASWNLGINLSRSDLVCVLNNDLVIHKRFFETIRKAFHEDSIAIAVPNTLGSPAEVRNFEYTPGIIVEPLEVREGWAFTIRKSALNSSPLIPSDMFNFCGDDYLFELVEKKGYRNIKVLNAVVHHITAGVSFRSVHNKEEEAKAKLDHAAWKKWKEENKW